MVTSGTVNYRELYFEYPDLTKIHGELTFETIKTIEDQLIANVQSVFSTLGGGQHGHLGLVLDPFNYSLVSATPFHIPGLPAPFVVIAQEAPHEAQTRLNQHNTNVKPSWKSPESKKRFCNKSHVQSMPFISKHSATQQLIPWK